MLILFCGETMSKVRIKACSKEYGTVKHGFHSVPFDRFIEVENSQGIANLEKQGHIIVEAIELVTPEVPDVVEDVKTEDEIIEVPEVAEVIEEPVVEEPVVEPVVEEVIVPEIVEVEVPVVIEPKPKKRGRRKKSS